MTRAIDVERLRAAFDPRVRELSPPAARFPSAVAPRPAAVLLAVSLDGEPRVHAVVRATTLRDHAGEVGFPGGKREPEDEDLAATALREAHEEVAIDPSDVELLGALTPMPVITGRYWLHPYVGLLRAGAAPRIVSTEIARRLEIPIDPWLAGERTIAMVDTVWRDVSMRVPHFELELPDAPRGLVLYGASACALYELLARIASSRGETLPEARLTERPPWGDRYREFE